MIFGPSELMFISICDPSWGLRGHSAQARRHLFHYFMELLNHYRRRGLREARNYVPSGSFAVERHYIPLHPRSASHWVIVRMPLAVSALRRSLQVINGWKWRGLCLLGEWRVIGARAGSTALQANGSRAGFRWQHGVKLQIAFFFSLSLSHFQRCSNSSTRRSGCKCCLFLTLRLARSHRKKP